jgi:hypothetical protein
METFQLILPDYAFSRIPENSFLSGGRFLSDKPFYNVALTREEPDKSRSDKPGTAADYYF